MTKNFLMWEDVKWWKYINNIENKCKKQGGWKYINNIENKCKKQGDENILLI